MKYDTPKEKVGMQHYAIVMNENEIIKHTVDNVTISSAVACVKIPRT